MSSSPVKSSPLEGHSPSFVASANSSFSRTTRAKFGRGCNHPHSNQKFTAPQNTHVVEWTVNHTAKTVISKKSRKQRRGFLEQQIKMQPLEAMLSIGSSSRVQLTNQEKKIVARKQIVAAIRKQIQVLQQKQTGSAKPVQQPKAKVPQKALPAAKAAKPIVKAVQPAIKTAKPVIKSAKPAVKPAVKAVQKQAAKPVQKTVTKTASKGTKVASKPKTSNMDTTKGFMTFSPFDSRFPSSTFVAVSPFDDAAWKGLTMDAADDFVTYSPFDDRFNKSTGTTNYSRSNSKKVEAAVVKAVAKAPMLPAGAIAPSKATESAFPRFSPMARPNPAQAKASVVAKPAATNSQVPQKASVAASPSASMSPLSKVMKQAGASPSNMRGKQMQMK